MQATKRSKYHSSRITGGLLRRAEGAMVIVRPVWSIRVTRIRGLHCVLGAIGLERIGAQRLRSLAGAALLLVLVATGCGAASAQQPAGVSPCGAAIFVYPTGMGGMS